MSRVQYYCATTLDGYIADADDGIQWLTGYEGSFKGEGAEAPPMTEGGSYERFYQDVGGLVSGSVTYEFVLKHMSGEAAWPYPGKPCWVLSSRDLPTPPGDGVDVRIKKGEVTDLFDEMLTSAGERNLWVVGGGDVASQFADAGLLDEVIVTVVPVVLGEGKQLFERPLPAPMQLSGARTFTSGMVELRYELGSDGG